ncbi:MAG: helix-hairpin-helix domain-containing protein [Lachnospiraceae bacterium]|nr:helix-hairpin-helix domain-containing protein [Lachnospiraceae bacterium]
MLQENRINKTGFVLVLFLCTVISCSSCKKKSYIEMKTEEKKESIKKEVPKSKIYVDIEGAVNSPGVYKIDFNSRIFNAIDAAGGLREDAYVLDINQAEKVEDGQKVYIFSLKEYEDAKNNVSGAEEDGSVDSAKDGKLNLNKASKEELMGLPGIGESKAVSIIKYREEKGRFKKSEDLMKISGIKEGVYKKIQDLIKVD